MRMGGLLQAVVLAAIVAGCASGGPVVLSGYGALHKPGGSTRIGPHPAIDFDGRIGDPVLAAADGVVVQVIVDGPEIACGHGIKLWHADFNRVTLYCQLHSVKVEKYQRVSRGEVIGLLGNSGEPSWVPSRIPMLHFGLSDSTRPRDDGDLRGAFDPAQFIVGCFEEGKAYPKDRLVLTYPVRCQAAR